MVDRRRMGGFQRAFNRFFVWLYRRRGGKLAFKGAPSMVLHTIGRKSGQARQTPLLYVPLDNGQIGLVASNGGDDHTPAWVHNLIAEPNVEAEVGGVRGKYRAVVADDATRAEVWPKAVALYKTYDAYQTKTTRQIPIVILTPATS